MSNVLRLAIVDPNDGTREALKTMLLGMDIVWLEAECSRYEFFADVVGQTNPDIGIVSLDSDPDKAIAPDSEAAGRVADCSIARRQQIERRPVDPAGDASWREGISHAPAQD